MAIRTVTDAIRYVGVDDNTLALFENQYPVQPMGVSYNSYVILDEKIAVMDSVDARAAEEWLSNVARVLEGRSPDYLVVTHMEPDHSGSLMRLAQKYPEMKIVGNAKTFTLIKQFFGTGALSVFKYDFLKYLKEYYLFFIVSILFSTRLPYKLLERIRNSVLVPILLLAIFSASIYCMYKGFDDPFLYFRF